MAGSLETFLVEWKHLDILVEVGALKNLETFLVEWKLGKVVRWVDDGIPLKPS